MTISSVSFFEVDSYLATKEGKSSVMVSRRVLYVGVPHLRRTEPNHPDMER